MDAQFLKMLDTARDGLSHRIPGASMEQVLKAALQLLLEKQARARGLVKRPRKVLATPIPIPTPASATPPNSTSGPARTSQANLTSAVALAPSQAPTPGTTPTPTKPPPPNDTAPRHRRTGPRQHIPVAISRAVWQRDGGRCSWPLDSGGICGSTHRLELDHVVPWARWGGETVDDLRIVCRAHNAPAARQAFGGRCVARYGGRPRP